MKTVAADASHTAKAGSTEVSIPAIPAHVRQLVSDARPAGGGKMTWFGFHVYDAQLFVPERFDSTSTDAAIGSAFVLELTYARTLNGTAIADSSRDEIARLGFGTPAQRLRWHEQMSRLFPNVTRGQRLAGANVPGVGVQFLADGKPLGAIDDTAFAQAFFAIWLDPRTRAPRLREQLLKGLAASAAASDPKQP